MESEALANGFRFDLRSMRGSSEVRFALIFTGFCRCRMLCAWSVRRMEKLRKNSRLELQNRGSGRPRGAQRSKFERKNGQLARKYTLEVPSGPPKNFKSARTRALRASKSACERPRRARSPKPPRPSSVISKWIFALVPNTGGANDEMCAPTALIISEMCALRLENNNRLRR